MGRLGGGGGVRGENSPLDIRRAEHLDVVDTVE